jgi:hypothetical protein
MVRQAHHPEPVEGMLEPGVLLQQNDVSIRQSRRRRNAKVKNEISKMLK